MPALRQCQLAIYAVPVPMLLRTHRLRRLLGDSKDAEAEIRVIQDAVNSSELLIMDASGTYVGPKPNPDSESERQACQLHKRQRSPL